MTPSADKYPRNPPTPKTPHSDGHLDQDKSGRIGGKPGQGGTDTDPARSGQLTEDPTPEKNDEP